MVHGLAYRREFITTVYSDTRVQIAGRDFVRDGHDLGDAPASERVVHQQEHNDESGPEKEPNDADLSRSALSGLGFKPCQIIPSKDIPGTQLSRSVHGQGHGRAGDYHASLRICSYAVSVPA
jgi:hypothetical protein